MNMREEVKFSRNAEAVMIPSGEHVLVPTGSQATITQSLGGSYTLITDRGLMIRVSGRDAIPVHLPQTMHLTSHRGRSRVSTQEVRRDHPKRLARPHGVRAIAGLRGRRSQGSPRLGRPSRGKRP